MKRKSQSQKPAAAADKLPSADEVIARLRALADTKIRDGMLRYGITGETARNAFGVPVNTMRALARQITGPARALTDGRRQELHQLAGDLWEARWYEARMLACFIDSPELVTSAQMDRWVKDFDNWATCDTACFCLFDKPPLSQPPGRLAYRKVEQWAKREGEFVRRAAYALLASLALHDKPAEDAVFLAFFSQIERDAADDRNFVKKAVSWALHAIGKRNSRLKTQSRGLAARLAGSDQPAARWIGKDVLRDLKAGKS